MRQNVLFNTLGMLMNNGYILGLATAVPLYKISQREAMEKIIEFFALDGIEKEHVEKLYKNSGIEKRHIVIDNYLQGDSGSDFLTADYPKSIPGMSKRNKIYKEKSTLLAHEAADKALKEWGGSPQDITHIISISCTGVVIPGIEFQLMHSLLLKRNIYRLGLNFMGCFGAFKGLEVANAFAKENPKNRVLVVCTELCSLHIQADQNPDSLLANSIFADGAAAVIVGAQPLEKEKPIWEIMKHASFGVDGSLDQMSWEASDHGFVMKLSGFVPLTLSRHISSFKDQLLDSYTTSENCDWAIHPGGKAIIHTIEKKLKLEESQTTSSWDVLKNFGNMSSATFLFVLDHLKRKLNPRKWTAGLGFGPGLSVEGILLSDSR